MQIGYQSKFRDDGPRFVSYYAVISDPCREFGKPPAMPSGAGSNTPGLRLDTA